MNARLNVACALLLLTAAGCGEPAPSGLTEPLRLQDAQWKPGKLPPAAEGGGDNAEQQPLRITTLETNSTFVKPGQLGKTITGRASDDGYAVALRFADLGTGYWVKPLGDPDPSYPGELSFRVAFELSPDVPPGLHELQFAIVGEKGQFGPTSTLELCTTPSYDPSRNACDPTVPPPAAVISLSWDAPSDLDLIVVTPSGKVVDPRHPSTTEADSGIGLLDSDANPSCAPLGSQQEHLVFDQDPEPGAYLLYVNQFNPCGTLATHFELRSYQRQQLADETYELALLQGPARGVLLANGQNGESQLGLYVTSVQLAQ